MKILKNKITPENAEKQFRDEIQKTLEIVKKMEYKPKNYMTPQNKIEASKIAEHLLAKKLETLLPPG